MAKNVEMLYFLRDLDPEAYSVWVITTLYYNNVVLTYITLLYILCRLMLCYVMLYCVMQEKEQELMEACKSCDFEEANRLVGSGVSVMCRNRVSYEITESLVSFVLSCLYLLCAECMFLFHIFFS